MKHILTVLLMTLSAIANGQASTTTKLEDLSAPKSPGFQLVDISPTNIEAPNTPKEFIVGILQSFDANTGWPQNYSMETSPYWWVSSANKDVYAFLGLKRTVDAMGNSKIGGQQIWSGLKFTSVSASFISKDMIPDAVESSQKIFAGGIRTRILKVHQQKHITRLKNKLDAWAAQGVPIALAVKLSGKTPAEQKNIINNYWKENPDTLAERIADFATEQPIFALDIAGAYASYGIGDSLWQTGRSGIWTTLAANVPLNYNAEKATTNYVNLLATGRFLYDRYAPSEGGQLIKSNLYDVGAKIGFKINNFSFAYEIMWRYYAEKRLGDQQRNVGIINYKIKDGLYINGAFGKNFGYRDNVITLFGINWGLGSEKVGLPD